jgi:allophanate hydrolase subunit 2
MLRVIDPGPLATVQDAGRFGYQKFGVPVSGAMDGYALRAANALVGNAPDAAGLEIGIEGLTLEASDSHLIAVTGVGFELRVHESSSARAGRFNCLAASAGGGATWQLAEAFRRRPC